jgi:hypothetical protein
MKFLGKWMDLEDIILCEVTQSQNTHDMYLLILAQKVGIPKIQFTKHLKLKKKEGQSVDTSVLVRRGNKIPMEGVTESSEQRLKERPSRDCLTWGCIP